MALPSKRTEVGRLSLPPQVTDNSLPSSSSIEASAQIAPQNNVVVPAEPPRQRRHRQPFTEEERQLVHGVRIAGACDVCRRRKVKCLHTRSHLARKKARARRHQSRAGLHCQRIKSPDNSSHSSEIALVNQEYEHSILDPTKECASGRPLARYVKDVTTAANPVPWFIRTDSPWRDEIDGDVNTENQSIDSVDKTLRQHLRQLLLSQKSVDLSSYIPSHESERRHFIAFPNRITVQGENEPWRLQTGEPSRQPLRVRPASVRTRIVTRLSRESRAAPYPSSHDGRMRQRSLTSNPPSNSNLSPGMSQGGPDRSIPTRNDHPTRPSHATSQPSTQDSPSEDVQYQEYHNLDFDYANTTGDSLTPVSYSQTSIPSPDVLQQTGSPYPPQISFAMTVQEPQQSEHESVFPPNRSADSLGVDETVQPHPQPSLEAYSTVNHFENVFEPQRLEERPRRHTVQTDSGPYLRPPAQYQHQRRNFIRQDAYNALPETPPRSQNRMPPYSTENTGSPTQETPLRNNLRRPPQYQHQPHNFTRQDAYHALPDTPPRSQNRMPPYSRQNAGSLVQETPLRNRALMEQSPMYIDDHSMLQTPPHHVSSQQHTPNNTGSSTRGYQLHRDRMAQTVTYNDYNFMSNTPPHQDSHSGYNPAPRTTSQMLFQITQQSLPADLSHRTYNPMHPVAHEASKIRSHISQDTEPQGLPNNNLRNPRPQNDSQLRFQITQQSPPQNLLHHNHNPVHPAPQKTSRTRSHVPQDTGSQGLPNNSHNPIPQNTSQDQTHMMQDIMYKDYSSVSRPLSRNENMSQQQLVSDLDADAFVTPPQYTYSTSTQHHPLYSHNMQTPQNNGSASPQSFGNDVTSMWSADVNDNQGGVPSIPLSSPVSPPIPPHQNGTSANRNSSSSSLQTTEDPVEGEDVSFSYGQYLESEEESWKLFQE